VLVHGIVADGGNDDLAGWHLPLNGIAEADKFLKTMALHVTTGPCC
jgi:hypothetical protein